MLVNGKQYETIWYDTKTEKVNVINQQKLPFVFEIESLKNVDDIFNAIKNMTVRGAPLIGVSAAYGFFLAVKNCSYITKNFISDTAKYLISVRPTAVNLEYAVKKIKAAVLNNFGQTDIPALVLKTANEIKQKEIKNSSLIGDYGLLLIEKLKQKHNRQINILTHCNAGWLACVDWGTALAPIYKAHLKGIDIHVWVDETRPRNQGAKLTAWELKSAGVPYTVIPDNTGGHLMQHGMVDLVLVGSDRTTRTGDVANKIGTYLKALAAKDNNIPFYVALPLSSIDFNIFDGLSQIEIEQRDANEIIKADCMIDNNIADGYIMHKDTNVLNYGFDVTPARLVTRLITEKGICKADEKEILELKKQ
jgi:methylthioribose-1-phosphate isomerase